MSHNPHVSVSAGRDSKIGDVGATKIIVGAQKPTTSLKSEQVIEDEEKTVALFHKEADDSFFYDDLKPYFAGGINKSIGVLEVAGNGHGTCFRVGTKYVMSASHVAGDHPIKSMSVRFEERDQVFKIKENMFQNQEKDVVIFEVNENDTLPEPLNLDKTLVTKADIFGYPKEKRLRIDIGCPVYTDPEKKELKQHIGEAMTYWKKQYPDASFKELDTRTALHSSRTFEEGASGGPLTKMNDGKPLVVMMYQGGTPASFYRDEDRQGKKHPMKHRFEYGISMKDVSDLLINKGKPTLEEDIFKINE